MMKTIQSILCFLILVISICAAQVATQHQKTDRESNGLKGGVKTVKYETVTLTKNGNSWTEGGRIVSLIENYDEQGNMTQRESYLAGKMYSRKTFFNVDGNRATKVEIFANRGGTGPGDSGIPDPRFDYKFEYEYDAQGNRVKETEVNTYGRKIALTINKYDARGKLLESNVTQYLKRTSPTERTLKVVYHFNDKGETIRYTKPFYSAVYSEYKYDEKGNWINRKVNAEFTYDNEKRSELEIGHRTITYYVAPAN